MRLSIGNVVARHLQRRPNNSIGCLEETKLRSKGDTKPTDVLQVILVQKLYRNLH